MKMAMMLLAAPQILACLAFSPLIFGKAEVSVVQVELVPLSIELPKRMFIGTPTDIRTPNFAKQVGKMRPPYLSYAFSERTVLVVC